MINTIKNLYKSEDLPGEFLLQPLKVTHQFLAKSIKNSKGLNYVALVITGIVAGIFAYPFLGGLAGVGMLVKLTGIRSIKKHNEAEKYHIEAVRLGVLSTGCYTTISKSDIIQSGWEMHLVREYTVTKQNVSVVTDTVKNEIDSLTDQFKKAFLSTSGIISYGHGTATVELSIRKRVATI